VSISPSYPTPHPTPYLTPEQLRRDCGVRDLSDPNEGPHAIQLLVDRAVERLGSAWGCEVRWCRGPRVVPVADNYDRLGYAQNAISRETRYTRYVDHEHMLRSHSSAMIPAALRELAATPTDDVLCVSAGIVFRRDSIDWQHTGTPQQLDLWRITRQPVGDREMDEMISLLLGVFAEGLPHREEARVHPYTLNGRQIDVLWGGRWVEVWECGLAHPKVLAAGGLEGWHGLALGMGLDRLLMLTKGIPDIRLLRSVDPRVSGQMLDLAPYRPVSVMPSVRRDLSIAVAAGDNEETLGDRVRDALGDDASCVEEVAVLSATPYDELPAQAIERLGALPGQKNLLVRVVLRDLASTLTDERANDLRDRVYGALHQGSMHQWASSAMDDRA
jgi:phenylalanyl-tRNA synthetase alpha chain